MTALLVVAALPGCRDSSPAGAGDRGPEQVRTALQRSYDLTWGGPRARQALEVSAYVAEQEQLAGCLGERGKGLQPAPFVDVSAQPVGPLSWYDALLPVDGGDDDLLVPVQVQLPEVAPERTWSGPPASPEDHASCAAPVPPAVAVDPGLDEELYALVTDALGPRVQVADYATCLAAAGFEAADRDDLLETVLSERPEDGGPGPREAQAVAADVRCRSQAHAEAMSALDAPLDDFERRHAERLVALVELPDELQSAARADAARLGLVVDWR